MRAIPLVNGRGVALVDDEDFDALTAFRWRRHPRGYAIRAGRAGEPQTVTMHRQIMQPPAVAVVDHINHDTSDNRRANLRVCTQIENMANRRRRRGVAAPYLGVTWSRGSRKWEARLQVGGEMHWLGVHATAEEAARVVDEANRRLRGEYAYQNFSARRSA